MELPLKFRDGEHLLSVPQSREISSKPQVILARAETNKGVIFNFLISDNGEIKVSSNYGFILSNDGLSTNFDVKSTDFVDQF